MKKSALGVAGISLGEFRTGFNYAKYLSDEEPGKATTKWIKAADVNRIKREGDWREATFRYAEQAHLRTDTDGSSLVFHFEGVVAMIRLGQHGVPAYGNPNSGTLFIKIDEGEEIRLYPLNEPREIVLARNLSRSKHTLQLINKSGGSGSLNCIESFGYNTEPTGELAFLLTGKNNAYLVDARAILYKGDKVVANRLVRNWMTGKCRLTGLPPGEGYHLELHALGWIPFVADNITITAGKETSLKPVYLKAAPPEISKGWLFPYIGRQAIQKPGGKFRARFQCRTDEITEAQIRSRLGTATFSRNLNFEEDTEAAYYYDRELILSIPNDAPPGLYDLVIRIIRNDSKKEYEMVSFSSVMVVKDYPKNPVFISWGHLDTQGQYQAEYLKDLAEIANLSGADMVLMACSCNPAYIAGALSELEIPYVINFGNHQFAGFEQWYGPQESMIDYGPDLCILNRSLPWHESTAQSNALLSERSNARIKVINAFEHNAPPDLFDNHKIALIHDGHGTDKRVMKMGNTPTQRVGKISSESFRIIRFEDGRVVSCTYMNDEVAPIPFPRGTVKPLRMDINPPANGLNTELTLTITNDLLEPFPNCRATLLMPAGRYSCNGGYIESTIASDCNHYTKLILRTDVPPEGQTAIKIYKNEK